MPPNSGYHCSLFRELHERTGGPCAQWDSYASKALSHPAFQPFTWPVMFDTSATYVDVKVFNGNEVLFHWVFRGYRSDSDLSVQQQFCDEVLIRTANEGWFPPLHRHLNVRGMEGLRYLFRGRSPGVHDRTRGSVVASDHAMSNCELRVTSRSSRRGLWQRCRSHRVPVQGCQQPDRPQVRTNVRSWDMVVGQPHLWVISTVICRRLVYTYTCAHVRIHANFVSLRSLTAQDQLCARSACAWECRCCLLAVQSNLRL